VINFNLGCCDEDGMTKQLDRLSKYFFLKCLLEIFIKFIANNFKFVNIGF